ncbi:MAG: hypothetical protein WCB27_14820 [Thermoguttaceae bacterium]
MTHFSWPIDGSIVGLYLIATMVAGLMVRRYVAKVDDFLVAGREMDVYLGIASLAATEFGIVTCMYAAQNGYKHGFAGATPGILYAAAMLVVGWTGFCIKPLRDSNAITIPELLERQFGPRIRWLAGVVIVLGGLLSSRPTPNERWETKSNDMNAILPVPCGKAICPPPQENPNSL